MNDTLLDTNAYVAFKTARLRRAAPEREQTWGPQAPAQPPPANVSLNRYLHAATHERMNP